MRDSSWRCFAARTCIKNTTRDVGLQPSEKSSRAKKAKPDANVMSREPVVENCIEPVNTRILRRLARESFSCTPKVVNPLRTDKKKEDVILESRTCGRGTWKEASCTIRSCECETVGGHDKSYSTYNNPLIDTKARESGFEGEGTITGPGVLYSRVGVDSRKMAATTEIEFQNLKSTDQNFQARREVYAVNPRRSSPNEQFRNLKTSCPVESALSPSQKAEQSKESKKLPNLEIRSTIGASSDEVIHEEDPRNALCARASATSRDQPVKGESKNISWGKKSTSTPNAQAVSKEIPRNLLYEIGVSEEAHSQSPRLTCLGKSTQQKSQTGKPKNFMQSAVQELGAQDSSSSRSVTPPAAFSPSHRSVTRLAVYIDNNSKHMSRYCFGSNADIY